MKPIVHFNDFEQIHKKVLNALESYPIDEAEYQYFYSNNLTQIEKLELAAKYVNLKTYFICGFCFERKFYEDEMFVYCEQCGTDEQGNDNKNWSNTHKGPGRIIGSMMNSTNQFQQRTNYKRIDNFIKLLDCERFNNLFIEKYKDLQKKFEMNKEALKRKSFFNNKFILQYLKEIYLFESLKPQTSAEKKQRKQCDELDWPDYSISISN